jgi:hypothetical protein
VNPGADSASYFALGFPFGAHLFRCLAVSGCHHGGNPYSVERFNELLGQARDRLVAVPPGVAVYVARLLKSQAYRPCWVFNCSIGWHLSVSYFSTFAFRVEIACGFSRG